MATNRFGDFNAQPIYNVTGRLNRGPEANVKPFQAPNSGAARQWGSNQGMPNSGVNPLLQSLTSYWSPINMYDMARMSDQYMYEGNPFKRGGGGRGRKGGGDGQGDQDGGFSMEDTPDGPVLRSTDNSLNVQIGGPITFAEQNRGAMAKTVTVGQGAAPSAKKPRAPRTDAQKAQRNEKDRARRVTAKQGGQASTPGTPAGQAATTMTTADTASANQVANPQYNANVGPAGRAPRSPFQGPQAPGGASVVIGNVTGGKLNQPPTQPRKRK
jgi:hypothetical protein